MFRRRCRCTTPIELFIACWAKVGPPPLVAAAFPGVVVEVRSIAGFWAHAFSAMQPWPANSNASCTRSWLERQHFLRTARLHGRRLVVLDIPLLFETGGERACDAAAVVSAPTSLQYARLLQRPGMSPERIATIMRWQMPDEESDGAPTSSS